MKNNIYISMSRKGSLNDKKIEKYQIIDERDPIKNEEQNQKGQSKLQVQRKLRKQRHEFKQCKIKVQELKEKLSFQIQPQRQIKMKQLLSKHEQIVVLTQSMVKNNQQSVKIQQISVKLNKQKLFEQKLLRQAIEHKQELNESISKVLDEVQRLEMKKTQLQLQRKHKQEEINQQKLILQQIDINSHNTDSLKYKQLSLKQRIQNELKFNSQLRECLTNRLSARINLTQAIQNKQQQLQNLNKQNIQLQKILIQMQQKISLIEQKRFQSLNDQSSQYNTLNHITMENTQLKARLQILKHTLSQQINKSNHYHDQIYNIQKLHSQSQQADQQTNQILQQLIKIKLQAQYLQSRTKNIYQ